MLDHISIGVKDLARAGAFYDAVLQPLGYRRLHDGEQSIAYGAETMVVWLNRSRSPVPPDSDSGLHFCFRASSRAAVDAFHAAGLACGGRDNGAPGLRPQYTPPYYAAFLVDPDGYRIEALCRASE